MVHGRVIGWVLLAALLGACTGGRPAAPAKGEEGTTIILVRHAEKLDSSADAPLSAAGEERAQLLARMLMRSGVKVLLASEFQRTQLTVRPLAEALGLPIRIIPSAEEEEVLEVATQGNRGGTALIASHSDRIPVLIRHLTEREIQPIGEDEYNRLYVVTLLGNGAASLLELRFGEGEVQVPERSDPLAPFPADVSPPAESM